MRTRIRLRPKVLFAAAAEKGDENAYRISQRSGVDSGQLSRALRGQTEPSTGTLMKLATTYGLTVDQLIEQVDEDPQPAGAA